MINVLWLPSWYPNKTSPYNGDFIQRHAKAVSLFCNVHVIFLVKDNHILKDKIIEEHIEGNLIETIVYYKSSITGVNSLDRILSQKRYQYIYKQFISSYIVKNGLPSLVHVHVALKAGILAIYLKKKFKIPYLITEHWSGYFPDIVNNIYSANFILKNLNKKILQGANLLLPVTNNLGLVINNNFTKKKFVVIPNVVDTTMFFYFPNNIKKFKFIHPSTLDYNKNPEGILKACKKLRELGYDFELLMVGKQDEKLIAIADNYNLLNKTVFINDAIPYSKVAEEMRNSSALLMFSRFESLPCVILEALCTGLPVISSNVGGIAEVVNETNGILVQSENIDELVNAMCNLIDNYTSYNKQLIANEGAEKFNYIAIGKKHLNQYILTLENNKLE